MLKVQFERVVYYYPAVVTAVCYINGEGVNTITYPLKCP